MSAWRLTISLLRIPRLFGALILFPLLISLLVVYAQLVVTASVTRIGALDSAVLEHHYERRRETDIGKRLVFGDRAELSPIQLCLWQTITLPDGRTAERPVEAHCMPDRLDAAIRADPAQAMDYGPYLRLLDGWVERLHVCQTCKPDIVITVSPKGVRSDVYSAQALILLGLTRNNQDVQRMFVSARRELDRLREFTGEIHFHAPGLRTSLGLDTSQRVLAVIANIAGLVIVALWLALKSHRKVLDYFARNGALLPMVAATGQRAFYGALWILTLIRVGAFLAGAVPLTLLGIQGIMDTEGLGETFLGNPFELALWFTALVSGFGLATLVASLADLKHRHHLLSALYKYVPLALCLLGTVVWTFTFILDGSFFGHLRTMITAIPVLGMGPVLVAPALKPELFALTIHTVLTVLLAVWALKSNARWFAAHLEEL